MDFAVNYIPVFVAAFVACVLGFMWHGPVFGQQWIKLMKITPAQMKKGQEEMAGKMPTYLFAAYIQQVITAYVIAVLIGMIGVSDAVGAAMFGFLLWLGLIATTLLNGVLWEERSIPLYLFNIAYQLVSIIVVTLIVGLWM